MKIAARWLGVLVLLLGLLGCAIAPQTPRQYFGATYQAISTSAEGLTKLAEGGVVPVDEALVYLGRLDAAKKLVDEGKSVLQCRDALKDGGQADTRCGPAPLAQSKAALASAMINQVQLFVARHQ